MGQEIVASHFRQQDFDEFRERLRVETGLLLAGLEESAFSSRDGIGGFELEAWLVDQGVHPAPVNKEFLERLDNPLVVPELARFNVELNGHPQLLQADALSRMESELTATMAHCNRVAAGIDVSVLTIGILPTVAEDELTPRNMSDMKRYRALNEQVLRLREGKPLELDILGQDHLSTRHADVMLESATTSFQIHLKISPERAVRAYNAALVASAPMVAVSANSPYLFGRDLWDETRIPLFEQSVAVGGYAGAAHGPIRRVTFGSGYARESIGECFVENLEHYPVLLPMNFEAGEEQFSHLRLHNGTIWRWNRPLVGFDDDGSPHLRIEHRVVPGGTSVADNIADAAFFFGLIFYYSGCADAPEHSLAFASARDNFYAAARNSLSAQINWLDGERGPVQMLVLDRLLDEARQGLESRGVVAAESNHYLGIIEARVRESRTGSAWQREYVAAHECDMTGLTRAYLERQQQGRPVHEWKL